MKTFKEMTQEQLDEKLEVVDAGNTKQSLSAFLKRIVDNIDDELNRKNMPTSGPELKKEVAKIIKMAENSVDNLLYQLEVAFFESLKHSKRIGSWSPEIYDSIMRKAFRRSLSEYINRRTKI